ncbi:MAG TPA: hypothetical protein VGO93_15450 [Candidatus Xenobia bacterium]|jgi:cell wall-associated NlpC family hydrolase
MAITATGSNLAQVSNTTQTNNPTASMGATNTPAVDTGSHFNPSLASANIHDGLVGVVGGDAPVALDTAAGGTTATPDAVVQNAKSQVGQVHGDGQCYSLVDDSLKAAGYKGAESYGKITANADYHWGTKVSLDHAQPGDVLQFRNFKSNSTTTTQTDTETSTATDQEERGEPNHSAIVLSNDGHGQITVLEQNVPEGGPVQQKTLCLKNGTWTNANGSTTTAHVSGQVNCYRPQPAGS